VGEQNEPWKIDELIAEGYDFLEEQKITKACFIWEKVWEEIKKVLTPEIRSVTELGYSLGDAGNVENWCQDYEMELENAGVEDLSFFKKRITYCREFVKLLPESDPLIIENMKRAEAESLFALGKIDEGEKAFAVLIKEYPNSAFVYIGWADLYWLFRINDKTPCDYEKAEKIYRKALESNVDYREEVIERLKELEKEKEKASRCKSGN
jgi:tetratricopeptide (TPR) repeat protein